jgi:hypothetical protein
LADQNRTSYLEPLFKQGIEDVIALGENVDLLVIKMRKIRERLLEQEKHAAEYTQDQAASSGDLAQISLTDLLRQLNGALCTVKLSISCRKSGDKKLVICLDRGEPVFASCDSHYGAEAIYEAVTWSEGDWEVEALKSDDLPDNNVGQSFESLVMECLRLIDHNSSQAQPVNG